MAERGNPRTALPRRTTWSHQAVVEENLEAHSDGHSVLFVLLQGFPERSHRV